MTGRDLIIFILENNLENSEINPFEYIPIEEFATMYGVGIETVKAWIRLGEIYSVEIGGKCYVYYSKIKANK